MTLRRDFYERDTAEVARDLLGKIFTHRLDGKVLQGRIVETEAYFGVDDPASRAKESKTKINEMMWEEGGLALVYMVHSHWLFNITTEGKDIPGAVLIRGVEPLQGLDEMRERRGRDKDDEIASGPGKFTQAFGISKEHHGFDLTLSDELFVSSDEEEDVFEVGTSHRIGVSEDLERELRFFFQDSEHVSR